MGDVWDEMEATVDGLPAEDGDLLYVNHGGMGKRTEGESSERPMIFYLAGVEFRRGP